MSKIDWSEHPVIGAAKRCGVKWPAWMGDWFTSWSPRNGNEHAEGSWEHWVTLAQKILNHPFTEVVRPEVYQAVPRPPDRYDETIVHLTEAKIREVLEVEAPSE